MNADKLQGPTRAALNGLNVETLQQTLSKVQERYMRGKVTIVKYSRCQPSTLVISSAKAGDLCRKKRISSTRDSRIRGNDEGGRE
ncbi:MAG: hypothetical protein ACR5LD_09940 [Symbiopectobacterium sp.]